MSEARSIDRIKQTIEAEAGAADGWLPVVSAGKGTEPAVGLVAREGTENAIAGSVLRASKAGHHVFVTYTGEFEPEAVEFARELGATTVEPGFESDAESVKRRLVEAAREQGLPGLIYQAEPAEPIDFERTRAVLERSTDYVVEPVTVSMKLAEDDIVVGIPAFNEAISIGSVVLRTKQYADEVIVVDDGSTDETVEVAREAGATVIEHEENQGKGAALRTLLDTVRPHKPDALVVLDGDGQHSPQDISQVVQPVLDDDADISIGSRYIDGAEHDTPRYRRFGQRVLDVLTVGSARTRVTDSQSGFRALSPKAIDNLRLRTDGFGVESEMINGAAENGLEIIETPINVRYDGVDSSTENPFRHGLAVVMFVVQLVRDRHPLVFFGVPGMVLAAVGLVYGLEGIIIYQTTGAFYPVKAMVSGFLTIIGTLGIFAGFMLNQISNILEYEGRGHT